MVTSMEGQRMDLRFTFLLFILLFLMAVFMKPAHARNEYLNSYSNNCRYGDMDVRIENERGNTDYVYGDSDYESDNYRASLTFRKYLGVSKKMCDEQNKILLENENLRQELELLKVCQKYADRPLPPQFATVEKHCKGLRARPERVKSDEPMWDEMKKKYIDENPDADIYNSKKKNTLKMPPENYTLPLPKQE